VALEELLKARPDDPMAERWKELLDRTEATSAVASRAQAPAELAGATR
jgi:hypothetical protein